MITVAGTDPRFSTMHARSENRVELVGLLGARLKERAAREWVELLRPLGIAVGAVGSLEEALDSDYVRSRGMVIAIDTEAGPLRMVGNPIRTDGEGGFTAAPLLHEHTDELLGEVPEGAG